MKVYDSECLPLVSKSKLRIDEDIYYMYLRYEGISSLCADRILLDERHGLTMGMPNK